MESARSSINCSHFATTRRTRHYRQTMSSMVFLAEAAPSSRTKETWALFSVVTVDPNEVDAAFSDVGGHRNKVGIFYGKMMQDFVGEFFCRKGCLQSYPVDRATIFPQLVSQDVNSRV